MNETAAPTSPGPAADRAADPHPDVPDYPFPAGPLEVPAEYAQRRAQCPLGHVRLPSGDEAVLLVTYGDVAAALADTRLSHDLTGPHAPRMTAEPSFFNDPDSMLTKDGEEHLRIRRIVASAFTPRRIARWAPAIEQIADDLIERLAQAGPPADLVEHYCFQLPVLVICRLLGVPEHDAPRFRDWSNAFVLAAQMTREQQTQQIREFSAYMADLIAQRREKPQDALIDDLIAARDGTDRLSEPELLHLSAGLLAAGNETTSNTLGRSVLALLSDGRAPWNQLLADPGLLPAAVEELLRFVELGNGATLRIATQDVDLPSGRITAGQTVAIASNSAKRDEIVYPQPDTLRFDRDAPPAPTFGGGPHYCLGAHLAKAELRIGLAQLLQRLPTLRLDADPGELRFTDGEILSSLTTLPVSW
ncbi:MAG TPA: cytochrome P450 [Actinocrinis sp.]|jgi:cytochrome P450